MLTNQQRRAKALFDKFDKSKPDSKPSCDPTLPVPQMPNICQGHISQPARAALDTRQRQSAEASSSKPVDKENVL